jgi:hypothetical protein
MKPPRRNPGRLFASTMFPAPLLVLTDDGPRIASVSMANTEEIVKASRWRLPKALNNLKKPTVEQLDRIQKAKDGIELAQLAAKRWRHYVEGNTAATSTEGLHELIESNPTGEFCFFLTISADWFPGRILGEVMLRRTWCHHLFMDFLYIHPTIAGQTATVRKGIGFALLTSVAATAKFFDIPLVWGEATETSSTWYSKQLCQSGDHPVKDHFFMREDRIDQFSRNFQDYVKLAANFQASQG